MQIDAPTSTYQLWDWTQNVAKGLSILNSYNAVGYWQGQLNARINYNSQFPSTAVGLPVDTQEVPCNFSVNLTGGNHPFSDAVWIKRYNVGAGRLSTQYIQFAIFADATTGLPRGVWIVNDLSDYIDKTTGQVYTWNYVKAVCSSPQ